MRPPAVALLLLLASGAVADDGERVEALLVRLRGKDAADRASAAKALGKVGDGPASAALEKALSDEDARVRDAAACALAARGEGSDRVLAVLTESLKSESWYLRWDACIAIGRMGVKARPAADRVLDLLVDEDPLVRRQAAFTLPEIAADDADIAKGMVATLFGNQEVEAVLFSLPRVHRATGLRLLATEAATNRLGHAKEARRGFLGEELLLLLDASSAKNRARGCDALGR